MAAEREGAPNPRAFWSGTLTFGLVSVPVDLFPAVRARRTALRMLGPDDQPLVRRYFCSADGRALTREDIVRGYENDDGSFTVVADEELDALAPRKSRDIDLRRFVAREEIPRQLLERPYVLAPAGESTKAYHLLAATMEKAGRAGIATFVMRGKEYLAAIFAEGGTLRAVTMRFADELRTPSDVGLPSAARPSADRRQEMERAVAELTGRRARHDIARGRIRGALARARRSEARRRQRRRRDRGSTARGRRNICRHHRHHGGAEAADGRRTPVRARGPGSRAGRRERPARMRSPARARRNSTSRPRSWTCRAAAPCRARS